MTFDNPAARAEQRTAALRTFFTCGHIPCHKRTGRIIGASVESIAFLGLFADTVAAADGTDSIGLFNIWLGSLAIGIVRTGKELAEATDLNDH